MRVVGVRIELNYRTPSLCPKIGKLVGLGEKNPTHLVQKCCEYRNSFPLTNISETGHTHNEPEKTIDQLFIKIKNFCSSKDSIKTMKMQTTEWEKIVGIKISTEDSYSEYFKNSRKSIRKRKTIHSFLNEQNI